MHKLDEIFQDAGSASAYARAYFDRLGAVMQAVDTAAVGRAADAIEKGAAGGRTLFLIANGGSAAVASHMVNDAVAGARQPGKPPMRALSLTDNAESLTAIANDSGFENVFARQLETMMQPGDVVLAMSVSGNSENLVRGLQYAKDHGGTTIAWTGFDGGKLVKIADVSVHMPTTRDEYGPIEDMFSVLMHAVLTYLTMKRGKKLHH